jgi:hypothetical protein
MQLRFTSFAVINLRRDLHPQECAHAGRTKQRRRFHRRRLLTSLPARYCPDAGAAGTLFVAGAFSTAFCG